ncbi:hypothetical protein DESUT3_03820 [Desulfuromonas versatilis]|uniref:Type IV pilus modification protein PilV n=1 Tax=Desulfuromonas versatilis TaxID=2802975 RepID=A0ABM8HRS1_9BACT|nr:prepilin-type N-terminal cleavage/methylation domain-containing protein [Desulfuromonas versatilis]BCR03313.1 hypothetical protein DESUT3_03820 [Desulfuromonas versatilis]
MRGRSKMDARGFSLVEILIGITIFAIGILAVATLQVSSMKTNSKANLLTQGSVLAQGKMEELIAYPFEHDDLQDRDLDGMQGLGDSEFDDDPGSRGDADYGPDPDQGQFRVYWNVAEDHPAVAGSRIKTIRVVVRWRERMEWKSTSIDYVRTN